jgi:hypothetical protein
MNFKITKRDILFFFIGLLAAFIIEVIVHWDNHVVAFGEGKKAAQENRR